jgi:hypothetical protein
MPPALVILITGASAMGKSHLADRFGSQRGFSHTRVDQLYTLAVRAAGMVSGPKPAGEPAMLAAEAEARRRARDRKWPDGDTETRFFAALGRAFKSALKTAASKRAIPVLDGGTLSRRDELKLVVKYARRVHPGGADVVRLHLEAPYERWLQNRVARALEFQQSELRIASLTPETCAKMAQAAKPAPSRHVRDITVESVEEAAELVRGLAERRDRGGRRVPAAEPLARQRLLEE